MNKILLSVVCLMVVGMQSVQAQVAICALHHNGSVTIYGQPLIQSAIDAAVQGDTLYLSEGTFAGFTVAKPIAIIGAGQTTVISGDVTIGSKDAATEEGLLLNGLHMLSGVRFYGITTGVRISQCLIEGNFTDTTTGSEINNLEILMSYLKGRIGLYDYKSISCINSKIGEIRSAPSGDGGGTFINCNVYEIFNGGDNNSFLNCILNNASAGFFRNCLYNSGSATYVDCQKVSTNPLDDNLDCTLSDEELQNAGYLGTDGTVVGITGGENPFTLVMSEMQVTQGSLEVDNVEKKLKVTLTLGNK